MESASMMIPPESLTTRSKSLTIQPESLFINVDGVQKDMFSMELQRCFITEKGVEIQIVKVSNVLSFNCICLQCGRNFLTRELLQLHMKTHLHGENKASKPCTSVAEEFTDLGRRNSSLIDNVAVNTNTAYFLRNTFDECVGVDKDEDGGDDNHDDITDNDDNDNDAIADDRQYGHMQIGVRCPRSGSPIDHANEGDGRENIPAMNQSSRQSSLLTSPVKIEVDVSSIKTESSEMPPTQKNLLCQEEEQLLETDRDKRLKDGGHLHTCGVCGKEFKTVGVLRNHAICHTEKRHSCTFCGKRFHFKWKMTEHMRTHTGEKPYPCSICGKGFSSRYNRRCHLPFHTGEKPFKCDTCGKEFAYSSNLRDHIKDHSGEKSHPCTLCDKSFARPSKLNAHMVTHQNVIFKCSFCDKMFKSGKSLRRHLEINHGDNSVTCEVCGKVFRHYRYLKTHLRLHQKVYTCSVCDKAFSSNPTLQNHMKKHNKLLQCFNCGLVFDSQNLLSTHLKEHQVEGNQKHQETKQSQRTNLDEHQHGSVSSSGYDDTL